MIPTGRLLTLLLVPAAAAIVAWIWPAAGPLWWIALGGVALIALVDAIGVRRIPSPRITRTVPEIMGLKGRGKVRLTCSNEGTGPVRVALYDHYPDSLEVSGLPAILNPGPGDTAVLTYRAVPLRRGDFLFPRIQLRLGSPLGLWTHNRSIELESRVRVYPDLAAAARYAALARGRHLHLLGIHARRRRGTGVDFHQLREYREGDSLRQIDWKATARMRRFISRDYQQERNQDLIFLLDCGHRMRAHDGELSHFDHSLNAILLLTRVALRHGDAVGVATFGGRDIRTAPRRGPGAMREILDALFDLYPTGETPDYTRTAADLLARHRKRSLAIVVTNFRDEDSVELLPALKMLQRRHLVLLASLREQELDDTLRGEIEDFDQALRVAAVHDYLGQRRDVLDRVRSEGVLGLDTSPGALSASLVNRYLHVKQAGVL